MEYLPLARGAQRDLADNMHMYDVCGPCSHGLLYSLNYRFWCHRLRGAWSRLQSAPISTSGYNDMYTETAQFMEDSQNKIFMRYKFG